MKFLEYKSLIKDYFKHNTFIFSLFGLILLTQSLIAQETLVVGQVFNKDDHAPISQVNIYFKNSGQVVQSNEEGYFMIRTNERHSTLIFSCVGYKQEQIHVKPGSSVGVQVSMQELNNELLEVFVVPGANPATALMRKVRVMRRENDLTWQPGFRAEASSQDLILLSKTNLRHLNKRIYEQLDKGDLKKNDSSLIIPLYMADIRQQYQGKIKKEISKDIHTTPESFARLLEQFSGQFASDINFYENSVTIFGKPIISPLAGIAGFYYDYFLADSLDRITGKQYEVHFQSKNKKNLAFTGKLWIDSTTLALTAIEASLPAQANINYVHDLKLSQQFSPLVVDRWVPKSAVLSLNMNLQLMPDSLNRMSEIFFRHNQEYQYSDTMKVDTTHFAKSEYSTETLESKLNNLGNTPVIKTARWIADAVLTGYMQAGKIDIGKIQQLARVTDIEGLRLNIPLRTNQYLWKDLSVGGYVGYGTKNAKVKYAAIADFRLTGALKRVIGISYTNDYRRIDYNYNNFLYMENPLSSPDEDISTTLLSLWSASKLNERKEFQLSFFTDWNKDIESNLYLRSHEWISNKMLPMSTTDGDIHSLKIYSATLNTRFSFNERTYEDHLQRIYIANNAPVLYLMLEAGKYAFKQQSGNYGKIMCSLKHFIHLDLGELDYTIEGGYILGKVPYPLLNIPMGTESSGYSMYQVSVPTEIGTGGYNMFSYNMMDYMEYGADKFINFHGQLSTNGLLMNQIPLIKWLNLREIFSLKVAYGSLTDWNDSMIQHPDFIHSFNKPYIEYGLGLSNILHFLSVQSVWRVTDLDHPGVKRWGIRVGLSIGL
ncbi:MAG: DUF5686 family protein [Paludibacter sp.]